MSWDHLRLAIKLDVERASDRIVALVYAFHANEETSLAYLAEATLVAETCLNRKSLIAARQRLVGAGFLVDRGRLRGRINGITVYEVGRPEKGTTDEREYQKGDGQLGVDVPVSHDGRPKIDALAVPKTVRRRLLKASESREEPARARDGLLSGWNPNLEDIAWAKSERREIPSWDRIAEKFARHYEGTKRTAQGWRELWQNWVRKERAPATPVRRASAREILESVLAQLQLAPWSPGETYGQAESRAIAAGGEALLQKARQPQGVHAP